MAHDSPAAGANEPLRVVLAAAWRRVVHPPGVHGVQHSHAQCRRPFRPLARPTRREPCPPSACPAAAPPPSLQNFSASRAVMVRSREYTLPGGEPMMSAQIASRAILMFCAAPPPPRAGPRPVLKPRLPPPPRTPHHATRCAPPPLAPGSCRGCGCAGPRSRCASASRSRS